MPKKKKVKKAKKVKKTKSPKKIKIAPKTTDKKKQFSWSR